MTYRELKISNKIKSHIRKDNKKSVKLTFISKVIKEEILIKWKRIFFIPENFKGLHNLIIEPISNIKSRFFIKHEILTAILIGLKFYVNEAGQKINQDLKKIEESHFYNSTINQINH